MIMVKTRNRSAKEIAEAWAHLVNTYSRYHTAEVREDTQDQDTIGTFYWLSITGKNMYFEDLYSVGWLQRRKGRQGPQVKFIKGRAQGFGHRAGTNVNINNITELNEWVAIVCGLWEQDRSGKQG